MLHCVTERPWSTSCRPWVCSTAVAVHQVSSRSCRTMCGRPCGWRWHYWTAQTCTRPWMHGTLLRSTSTSLLRHRRHRYPLREEEENRHWRGQGRRDRASMGVRVGVRDGLGIKDGVKRYGDKSGQEQHQYRVAVIWWIHMPWSQTSMLWSERDSTYNEVYIFIVQMFL